MQTVSSYGVEIRKQNIPIRQTLEIYRQAVSYLTEIYEQVWAELKMIPEAKKRFNAAGLGGFIGTEYVRHPDKEYNFIIGPKLETELEVFILPRTALLARIQQHWNPLSIDKWNTVWNVGIKILLY